MQKISAVIVCKNEEEAIGSCIASVRGLTDDIVVLDNGSTDNTKQIVRGTGARLTESEWEGFGKTKRKAVALAKYDWVICLDADEAIDEELKKNILQLSLANDMEVFEMRYKNFLGDKLVRFGEWGNDHHIRLFNRIKVNWDEAIVHESLVIPALAKVTRLKGSVLHYTMKDVGEYASKTVQYALLNAAKYARMGKKSSWVKQYLSPVFSFIKHYIFQLGFLDGRAGLICARMTAHYTFIKYARLKELQKNVKM